MHQISIDVEVTAHDVMRERESETERELRQAREENAALKRILMGRAA